MKKRISILAISILVAFFAMSQPLTTAEYHSLLMWVGGNTNTTIDKLDWTQSKLGAGGMLGVGYQWQKKLFAINTGLEISFQHRSLSISDAEVSQTMLDTERMPFLYRGWIKDRSDNMNMLDINIPLLAGVQGKAAYFLAGLKLSINGYTWCQQSALFSTDGLYDRFYDPLVNMPNHGFHDYQSTSTNHSGWLGAELMASAEVGILIPTKKENTKIRLGLFADYGLYQYNVRISNQQDSMLETDWSNFLQLQLNHAYLSSEGAKAIINNLNLGLKLTIQMQYGGHYPCLICRWNHRKFN